MALICPFLKEGKGGWRKKSPRTAGKLDIREIRDKSHRKRDVNTNLTSDLYEKKPARVRYGGPGKFS